MTYCYRNRDGAEREFEHIEDVPEGWVPRSEFKAWRAAGFPEPATPAPATKPHPLDHDGDGRPGGSKPRNKGGRPRKVAP